VIILGTVSRDDPRQRFGGDLVGIFVNPTLAVAFGGGVVAIVGGLLGQIDNVGTGTLIGGAGLVAAFTALVKGFWDDRRDARQTDLEKLRIDRSIGNRRAIRTIHQWIVDAHRTTPTLPVAPDLADLEHEQERPSGGPT
jgi:hypothetical protein